MAEPTIQDVLNAINERHNQTEKKIETSLQCIKGEIEDIKQETTNNKYRLSELEKNIEILKQDKLKNNIKISGLPNIKFDPKSLVYSICNLIDIELLDDEFNAYQTRNGNFIIVQFDNFKKKSLFFKKIIERQSIMAEEVFDNIESNSQIYISDHLTPYFARLFQLARAAKKDGRIHQVSSRGGKIRIKKTEQYQFIFSEYDLNEITNGTNTEPETNTPTNTDNHRTTNNNKYNNSKSDAPTRNNKRRADLNTSENDRRKKTKTISIKDNTPVNKKTKNNNSK